MTAEPKSDAKSNAYEVLAEQSRSCHPSMLPKAPHAPERVGHWVSRTYAPVGKDRRKYHMCWQCYGLHAWVIVSEGWDWVPIPRFAARDVLRVIKAAVRAGTAATYDDQGQPVHEPDGYHG